MIHFKNVLLSLSILVLTGCATTKENFDCKYGKGVGCRSITEVNDMVNQGKLGKEPSPENFSSNTVPSPVLISGNFTTTDSMSVQRVTEEHLRLWIAPFQDKQGNFHEGALVHTVLKPGFWQVEEGI